MSRAKTPGKEMAFPSRIKPMLATLGKMPFNHKDWIYEVKWDGYRILALVEKGKVKLHSRSLQDFTKNYRVIVKELSSLKHDAVIDGEVVSIDESGKPNFDELQRYNEKLPIIYYVFDLLWLNGKSLMDLPLLKRKELLASILPESDLIKFSDHFEDGDALFEQMKAMEMEGIVAKRKESIYKADTRSGDWLKIQTARRQEFVVGGWSESSSGRPFRSLVFGWYRQGELHYVGHAGLGFKEKEMSNILGELKKIEIKKNPFVNEVDVETKVHWTKPELVIEVKFSTFTRIGKIRKPAIFLGFRTDKLPHEVISNDKQEKAKTKKQPARKIVLAEDSNWKIITRQKVTSSDEINIEGYPVTITNVEKTLWDGVAKADLIRYYHSIAEYILPHLRSRPLSLHIKHIAPTVQGMYIKDMEGQQPDWAEIFTTQRKHKKQGKRDVIDYLVCNNLATLLYVINLGCIDVNPWTSRTDNYLYPDYIIIDLDPSDNDFTKAIIVAQAAKKLFDKKKLKVLPKTSGKTGIHLYIPCQGFNFKQSRTIAERICIEIHDLTATISTLETDIEKRGTKLYIDPNQNDEADTVASPYSVRPFYIPSVSTPLEWKELNPKLKASDFTIHNIESRLVKKGELFESVLDRKIAIANSTQLQAYL